MRMVSLASWESQKTTHIRTIHKLHAKNKNAFNKTIKIKTELRDVFKAKHNVLFTIDVLDKLHEECDIIETKYEKIQKPYKKQNKPAIHTKKI